MSHFSLFTVAGSSNELCGRRQHGGRAFCPDGKKVLVLNRALPAARGIAVTAPLEAVLGSIDGFTAWFERETARLQHGA
jgi:hypothetical protein